MNSENTKASDPRRLLLNLSEKINLKKGDKPLQPILASTTHRKILDRSNFVSNIQNIFECIIKKVTL